MAGRFSRRIRGYAKVHNIPVIECSAGDRKHDIAEEYLAKTKVTQGVFLILVGRAQAPVWDASANHQLERKKPMPHVVGFVGEGVFVALGNGDGKFQEPHKNPVLDSFCYKQGWRVDRHPRCLAKLTDSGFADIVGFGDGAVWTALSNGDGTYPPSPPNVMPSIRNRKFQKSGQRSEKEFVALTSDLLMADKYPSRRGACSDGRLRAQG